jgi:hypothetical protein
MTHFTAAGATVIHGCVREPTTGAWDPAYVHVRRYLLGYNVIESYFQGHPWFPWMNLVCGDPLTQPYAQRPVVAQESLEKGVLRVSAKATREGAAVKSLTLYVDGVRRKVVDGASAEFELKDVDPAVNSWRVVAEDDSKFRTQGWLASGPLKAEAAKVKVTLGSYTKGKATFKVTAEGKDPVMTFASPHSKEKVGTVRGKSFSLTFEDESAAHAVDVWVRNAKGEPAVLTVEVPAKKK